MCRDRSTDGMATVGSLVGSYERHLSNIDDVVFVNIIPGIFPVHTTIIVLST